MTKLVADKIQPALPAQAVRQQPDHLMKSQASVDCARHRTKTAHVRVHLGVHQPEGDRLVAYQGLVVALAVSNGRLPPTTILQSVNNIPYVPILVFHCLQDPYPLVGNGHGQSVVKAAAALLHGPAQCRHA